jgi:hypothetical protein
MRLFRPSRVFLYVYGLVVIGFIVVGVFFTVGLVNQFEYFGLPAMPWIWLFTYFSGLTFLSDNPYLILALFIGYAINATILWGIGRIFDRKHITRTPLINQ